MLVLSRKINEQILFPELGITVEVVRIKGNIVRLGIKAPESIRILRGELEDACSSFDSRIPPTGSVSNHCPPVASESVVSR